MKYFNQENATQWAERGCQADIRGLEMSKLQIPSNSIFAVSVLHMIPGIVNNYLQSTTDMYKTDVQPF